ncbi:LuxR family two component transcriptional regulator [Ulvibacter sp. MAR_2010_11]|uniref:response regulator n=1 Tax=Ulvibacter sp. MAR_2010_11 TaxID=1250229 RepID=UPI000C2B56F8|nr:response regulator transcription factor [Ulvibacter sp. MAR_2010_11]PKA83179.1 LuxR family two component transcriptional regulator [Ulvibacter sp. MAR_2010_11]
MAKKETIITADDHPLLLKGLNDFLLEKNFNIIGSGNNGREAYNLITKLNPDIAIIDIQMPFMSGLEIAQKCKTNGITTKIILITLHKERDLYQQAQDLNIFGYVLKEFALEEIETCIKTVSSGKPFFSPEIKDLLGSNNMEENSLKNLTPSEKKILKLIANDKTNKEIASLLFISYRTVEKHRSNIISKLDLEHKTNSLLIWAKEHQEKLI